MQKKLIFQDWLLSASDTSIAELRWAIKHSEAKLSGLLTNINPDNQAQLLDLLKTCTDLYDQLSRFYPPVETSDATHIHAGSDTDTLTEQWQTVSKQLRQAISVEDKAQLIVLVQDSLNKLTLHQRHFSATSSLAESNDHLPFSQLSTWFLSFIDLIRHQQPNSGWPNDFFGQLDTHGFQHLYQILTHPETAHLMFHIYYYQLFPDQLTTQNKHPDLLISLDHRLTFLYQCIEQFVATFILYSKTNYHLAPQDFLCHGRHLPKGITLRSKENYRKLIIQGLKKLSATIAMTEQTPTAELIDAIHRAYQFWFNPNRILDALFLLCKSLNIDIEQSLDTTRLYHPILRAFLQLETDTCVKLYGYFSNNDTRYLLRVLQYLGQGGILTELPDLQKRQRTLLLFLYEAFSQVIGALQETLNQKHVPCADIAIPDSTKPPKPGKRNLRAICHVINTYGDMKAMPGRDIDTLLSDIDNCLHD